MLTLFRVFLYTSTSWGILALFGLGPIVPPFLMVVDIVPILIAVRIVLFKRKALGIDKLAVWQKLCGIGVGILLLANLYIVVSRGGSILSAVQYLVALLRPISLLLLLISVINRPQSKTSRHRFYLRLVADIRLIITLQFLAAGVQVLDPTTGALFIPAISELQSGFAALDEGDVSGLLPNSIDFAYLAVAAYIVLTLDAVKRRGKPPNLLVSIVFGFFIQASGSDAATVCFVCYFLWLHGSLMNPRLRKILTVALVTTTSLFLVANAIALETVLIAKIDNMMLSRLGLIFISAPQLVSQQPSFLLTGLGPDFEMVGAVLAGLPDALAVLAESGGFTIVNDVFWFAAVVSLGIPLAFAYTGGMLQLLSRLSGPETSNGRLPKLFRTLALMILFAGLFNQILLVRSFYTVLLIGMFGHAFKAVRREPGD